MNAQKRTPHPWFYQEDSDAYTHIIRGPDGQFIAQLPQETSGRAEADARLIAAAPRLLAVLKQIVDSGKLDEARSPLLDDAIDVIADAEGRPR